MNTHIKTSLGLALILTAFLGSMTLVNTWNREFNTVSETISILDTISSRSQLAAISGAGSGLVAHYTFDDTTNDSAGSNHGTAVGGPTYVAGKIGKAMQFDGTDDYVKIGVGKLPQSPLTVCFWARPSTSDTNVRKLISLDVFRIYTYNGGWFMRGGSTQMSAGTAPIETWQHICGTIDNEGNGYLYKNGTKTGGPVSIGVVGTSMWPLVMGARHTEKAYFYPGLVDDFRIYSRVLSESEVESLYTLGGNVVAPEDPTSPPSSPPSESTCTSFTYSSWGACTNGTQTRTVTSSSPSGCIGGTPVTSQSCNTGTTDQSLVQAATCSDTDVQVAIDAVADQGVVLVPAGTCTWTKNVTIGPLTTAEINSSKNKSVILKGAGIDKTIIIDNNQQSGNGLTIGVQPGKMVRVTGFTFDGSNTVTSRAIIQVSGPPGQPAFRIDNNKFINVTKRGIITNGVYGLIDHNTLIRTTSTAFSPTLISVMGDVGGANDAWERPQGLGTENAVFMEDNTFIHSIQNNGPFDMYRGARYVFRHNKVHGNGLGHHGYDSDVRGVVSFEIYDNYITNASPEGDPYAHGIGFEIRSGSGVIFNNTVKRGPVLGNNGGYYDAFVLLRNYRSGDGYITNYGFTFPWDGKNPGNGVCDGTLFFVTGVWSAGFNYKVGDVLHLNQAGASGATATVTSVDANGRITGITPTTVGTGYRPNSTMTTTALTGNGTLATLSMGMDGNTPGMKGYPCQDQIGRTSGVGPDGKQTLSPVYSWNNSYENSKTGSATIGGHLSVAGYSTPPPGGEERINLHVVEGRDFFNGVPRPGYIPYVYPHPLSVSGFTSDAGGPVPPSTPINGSCGSVRDVCSTGLFSDVTDTTTEYKWLCTSYNGGTTASCSIPISSSPLTPSSISTSNITQTGAQVSQTTSAPATSQVQYGLTTAQGNNIAIPTTSPTTPTFTRYLTVGSTGNDVKLLQQTLNSLGYRVSTTGAGSPGLESIYYGPLTTLAIQKFQCAVLNLCSGSPTTNGYGNFGPQTRSALNARLGTTPASSPQPLVPSVPPTTNHQLPSTTITSWLIQGTRSPQVRTLQQILNSKGYTVSPTGPGSLGQETDYFGPATQSALQRFQCATLQVCAGTPTTTGYGATGPRTRGELGR